MIHVRKAGRLDAREISEILNEIIDKGGTTALADPVTAGDIDSWQTNERSAWHVAETDAGRILGFQWIEPSDDLPPDAAEIATFARMGHTGLGIGSALFRATVEVARSLGYTWIRANIRADNIGGLAYYQSRGFEDYGRVEGYRMSNGMVVEKCLKRFEL